MSDRVGSIPVPYLGNSQPERAGSRRASVGQATPSRASFVGNVFQAPGIPPRPVSSEVPQPHGAGNPDFRLSREQLGSAVEKAEQLLGDPANCAAAVRQAQAVFDVHTQRFGSSSGQSAESELKERLDKIERQLPPMVEQQGAAHASPMRRDTFDEKYPDDGPPVILGNSREKPGASPALPLPRLSPAEEKKTSRAVADLIRLLQRPLAPGGAPRFGRDANKIVGELPRGEYREIEFHRIVCEHLRTIPPDQRSVIDQNARWIGEPFTSLINAACQGRPAPSVEADRTYSDREIGKLFHLLEVSGASGKQTAQFTPHANNPFWILPKLMSSEFPTGHFDYKVWRQSADSHLKGLPAAQLRDIQKGIEIEFGGLMKPAADMADSENDVYKHLFPVALLDAVEGKLQLIREADRPRNLLQKAGRYLARPFKAFIAFRDRDIIRQSKMRQVVNNAIFRSLSVLSKATNDTKRVNSALRVLSNAMPGSRGEADTFDQFIHFALRRSPRDYVLHTEKDRVTFKLCIQLALSKLSTRQVLAILDNIERRGIRPQDTIHVGILRDALTGEIQRRPDHESVAARSLRQKAEIEATAEIAAALRTSMKDVDGLRLKVQTMPVAIIKQLDDDSLRRLHDAFNTLGGFEAGITMACAEIENRSGHQRQMYADDLRLAMFAWNRGNIDDAVASMESANASADRLVAWRLHAARIPMSTVEAKLQRQQVIAFALPPVLQGVPNPAFLAAMTDDQLRQVDAAFRKLSGFEDSSRLTGNEIPRRVAEVGARYTPEFREVTSALQRLNFADALAAMGRAEVSTQQLLVWEQSATGVVMGTDEASAYLQECVTAELAKSTDLRQLNFLLGATQRGEYLTGEVVELMDALKFYGYSPELADSRPELIAAMMPRFHDLLRIAEGVRAVFANRNTPPPKDAPEPAQLPEPSAKMKELLTSVFGLNAA